MQAPGRRPGRLEIRGRRRVEGVREREVGREWP